MNGILLGLPCPRTPAQPYGLGYALRKLRGLPRPRTPAQPLGLGYALQRLRGGGSMARAKPCALLPPSAPPCSLLLPKVAACPLLLERGGMIPLAGLAPTAFKTRAHSAPKSGVRSGL